MATQDKEPLARPAGAAVSVFPAASLRAPVQPIRFEEADSHERTRIGQGLTKPAVAAGRLVTGRDDGRYFLRHDDGCGVCGASMAAGEPFYLDPDAGEVLCEEHGRRRRGE